MSDLKISQLTPAISLTGNELIPLAISGTNESATTAQVAGLAASSLTDKYVPYNNAGVFSNSYIVNNNQKVSTVFSTSDWGLVVDFGNNELWLGNSVDGWGLHLNSNSGVIQLGDFAANYGYTISIDVASVVGQIYTNLGGDPNGFKVDSQNKITALGDFDFVNNNTSFFVDDNLQKIYTKFNNIEIGLNLNYSDGYYALGQGSSIGDGFWKGVLVSPGSGNPFIIIGDSDNDNPGNLTTLNIIDGASLIYTKYQGNDTGLRIDFSNNQYLLYNGLSGLYQYMNTSTFDYQFSLGYGNLTADTFGLYIKYGSYGNNVTIGDINGLGNGTSFYIDDSTNVITTNYNGSQIGLKLDFANNQYWMGFDAASSFYYDANSTTWYVGYNEIHGDGWGLKIQGSQTVAKLGDYSYSYNGTYLTIDDITQTVYIKNNNDQIGLKLDFANGEYFLGDFNAIGNGTCIKIFNGESIEFRASRYNYDMPVYATNAAAILGGLIAGDLYRTSTGEVRIVY